VEDDMKIGAAVRVGATGGANHASVRVSGRLDAAGVAAIEASIARAAEASPGGRLALDLADVSYLSSVGLRLLMLVARTLEKRGGRLVVANPTDEVAMVLAVAGLEKPLRVCAGEAAQAKAFT
jgi:anti-anti-sigma factor